MLGSLTLVRLRRMGRRLGLNRIISRWLSSRRYEDRFGPAVQAEVRAGDTVWDIGANLGIYTKEFVAGVGPSGRVVAFEPVSSCFAVLRERFADLPQVKLMNVAVGDADGHVNMVLDDNPLAPTHRVVGPANSGNAVAVAVRSSASIVAQEPHLFPNLVKIDVEGHEGAVMEGMRDLLADRRLRCIGIEVHFGLLDERGEGDRTKQMEQILTQHGFTLCWTDLSHLLAVR